jgi:hypothetical protein
MLRDIDPRFGLSAVAELCGSCEWPPAISQIRKAAYNLSRGQLSPPSAWEAWERAIAGTPGGDIETRAINLIGGTWAIKHSENPEVIRSQFLKCYSELLETHDREACAIKEVRQLAFDNREEVTPSERRISQLEQIEFGTPEFISAILRGAGF